MKILRTSKVGLQSKNSVTYSSLQFKDCKMEWILIPLNAWTGVSCSFLSNFVNVNNKLISFFPKDTSNSLTIFLTELDETPVIVKISAYDLPKSRWVITSERLFSEISFGKVVILQFLSV